MSNITRVGQRSSWVHTPGTDGAAPSPATNSAKPTSLQSSGAGLPAMGAGPSLYLTGMHQGASLRGKPSLEAALTGEASPAGTGARMPSGHEAPYMSGESGRSQIKRVEGPHFVLGEGAAWKCAHASREPWHDSPNITGRTLEEGMPGRLAPGPLRQAQTYPETV